MRPGLRRDRHIHCRIRAHRTHRTAELSMYPGLVVAVANELPYRGALHLLRNLQLRSPTDHHSKPIQARRTLSPRDDRATRREQSGLGLPRLR